MQQVKVWADNKDDFISILHDGDYMINKNLELVYDLNDGTFDAQDALELFTIGDAYHSTSRLRDYCNKFHPEVDFDDEFETDKPGVFARYQDKFDFDYDEWVKEQIYADLVRALNKRGYCLPFERSDQMSKVENSTDDMVNYIEGCIIEMQWFIRNYRDGEYDDGDDDFLMSIVQECTRVVAKVYDVDWKNLDWKV